MSDYGTALRAARHERGLTLRDLAARLGVSITHLSDVERGRRGLFSLERTLFVAKRLRTPALVLLVPWVAHHLPGASSAAVAKIAAVIDRDMATEATGV